MIRMSGSFGGTCCFHLQGGWIWFQKTQKWNCVNSIWRLQVLVASCCHGNEKLDGDYRQQWLAKIQTIDGVPPESTSAKNLTKPRHPEDGGSKILLHFWTNLSYCKLNERKEHHVSTTRGVNLKTFKSVKVTDCINQKIQSVNNKLITAVFWIITQPLVVISHQSFGTTLGVQSAGVDSWISDR